MRIGLYRANVFPRGHCPIVIVGAVGLATMLPHIISRFKSAPEASGNTRIELALCAKEMMLDEPWCGVGINNWGIKINPPYEYAELAGRNTNRGEDFKDGVVETVYLLVGAECGIPALMAMLLWFAHYLVLSVSLAKRLAGTPYAAISAGIARGQLRPKLSGMGLAAADESHTAYDVLCAA